MAPPEPSPPPVAAEPAPADLEDLACHRCNYPLRGLDPNGRCPECGLEISVSLSADNLRFADPLWLHAIHLGLVSLIAGIGAMAVSIAWSEAISIFQTRSLPSLGQLDIGGKIIFAFTMVLLITQPEPGRSRFEATFSHRRVSRILCALLLLTDLIPLYWIVSQFSLRGDTLLGWYNGIRLFLYALALTPTFLCFRDMAQRRADAFLSRHLPVAAYGLGAVLLAMLVFRYLPLSGSSPREPMMTAMRCIFLALLCYAGYLLIEFHRRLGITLAAAMRLSREHQAANN